MSGHRLVITDQLSSNNLLLLAETMTLVTKALTKCSMQKCMSWLSLCIMSTVMVLANMIDKFLAW